MALNENDVARVKHVLSLATKMKQELDLTIRYMSVENGTVKFFTTKDGSGNPAFTFNFPEELFLSQVGTTLVDNFAWSALTYPNSTNPNLDGKAVLVLAVKGDDKTNPTVNYNFVDVSKLIDIYTPADPSIAINGYSVAVNLSNKDDNILSIVNDGQHNGLYVPKLDAKVDGAVQGNIATFGASGAIVDSNITFVSDADFNAALSSIFG